MVIILYFIHSLFHYICNFTRFIEGQGFHDLLHNFHLFHTYIYGEQYRINNRLLPYAKRKFQLD